MAIACHTSPNFSLYEYNFSTIWAGNLCTPIPTTPTRRKAKGRAFFLARCSQGLREDCPSPIPPSSSLFQSPPPLFFPLGFGAMEEERERYSRELDVAVRVVQMACTLCQRVQDGIVGRKKDQIKAKDDDSPVTVADWGVQATVSWILSECFGRDNVSIVAEEDVQTLSRKEAAGLLESVVNTVNECLVEAPKYGLRSPHKALESQEVLEAIHRCNSNGGPKGRYWVLDPVDGTLGFVRGDQYAVALALIEDGQVVLGVLGCPNYPMKKQWLNYHQRYYRLMSKLSPPAIGSWDKGCVLYAQRGSGKAWMQPLVHDCEDLEMQSSARAIRVSSTDDPALATFCEPVEKANSSHSFTAGLAQSVGVRLIPNQKIKGDVTLSYPSNRTSKAQTYPAQPFLGKAYQKTRKGRCTESSRLTMASRNTPKAMELYIALTIRKQPLRVYSMVKYAAIARGDAEIFMKFARVGYKEKIWDHAAGVIIIEEAGGVVTDAGGRPLDFSRGIYLEGLDRGIIACSGSLLHEKIINAVDASWDSSSL